MGRREKMMFMPNTVTRCAVGGATTPQAPTRFTLVEMDVTEG